MEGEEEELGGFYRLFLGQFLAWQDEVYEAWIKAECPLDGGEQYQVSSWSSGGALDDTCFDGFHYIGHVKYH